MGNTLTPQMMDALRAVMCGIRKYRDGYRSIDSYEKVDGRSLTALYKRGLIWWQSVGGHPQRIVVKPTPEGDALYEQLVEEGQWD